MKKVLLISCLVLCISGLAFAQQVQKITITYATTGDDKDWNTQGRDNIVCNGVVMAELNCCDQDKNIDHWNDQSTTSRDMVHVQPFMKGALTGCTFNFGMVAKANDTWQVIPSITVFYRDGTNVSQTFDEKSLKSSSSLTSVPFPLD